MNTSIMNTKIPLNALIPLMVGITIMLIPAPEGLSVVAWQYFAMFVAVIVGLVLEPIPGSIIGLLGISVAAGFQLIGDKPSAAVNWALSGFSNSTIWLIFVAYMFGLGYEKTGLGRTDRNVKNSSHQADRIMESILFHDRVPGSDSLAKYAAAFFNRSRSILVSANSLRSREISASCSVTGARFRPIAANLPAFALASQLSSVFFEIANRLAASDAFRPSRKTRATASALNSGVYTAFGALSI